MLKQIMVLPLTLVVFNFSFQNRAMASDREMVPEFNNYMKPVQSGISLSTIPENSIFENRNVANIEHRPHERRRSLPSEEFRIPPYNPANKNKKMNLALKLENSAFEEDVPAVETRPEAIVFRQEMTKTLEPRLETMSAKEKMGQFREERNKSAESRIETKGAQEKLGQFREDRNKLAEPRFETIDVKEDMRRSEQVVKSKSDIFQGEDYQEYKIDERIEERKDSEGKISEEQIPLRGLESPVVGETFKFNANVFLEFYFRRLVTKSFIKVKKKSSGDVTEELAAVKDGLDKLSKKLDTVIKKAQNNSLFLLKCFSSKKAERFQTNVKTIRDLMISSYNCCCLFTRSVPVAVHNQTMLENLDRSAGQVLKNFDRVTDIIQTRMKTRNEKVTSTINVIADNFIKKAEKLKVSVEGFQKVAAHSDIDPVTMIDVIMKNIESDMETEDLSVEL